MAELKVIDNTDKRTHIALSGRLDILGVQEVELAFTSHVAARKRPAIVDMSQVDFVASIGIGMLVRTAKTLQSQGVSLVLLTPQKTVREVLELSKIDKVIPIAESLDEAVGYLA